MANDNPQKKNKFNLGNNPKPKKPRFNLTWFYIIIAVALGWLFINNNGADTGGMSKTAKYSEFCQYVTKGYASHIEVNTERRQLNMYVKSEHIRDVFRTTNNTKGTEPYITVTFGSIENVEKFLDEQQQQGNFSGELTYKEDAWAAVAVPAEA